MFGVSKHSNAEWQIFRYATCAILSLAMLMHFRSASLYSSFFEIKLFWLCVDLDAWIRWHCSFIASCSPSNNWVQVNGSSSYSSLCWFVVGTSIERKSADRLSKMLWKFCSPCARVVVLSLLKLINTCFTFTNNADCDDIFNGFYKIAIKKLFTRVQFAHKISTEPKWKSKQKLDLFVEQTVRFYILNRFATLKIHCANEMSKWALKLCQIHINQRTVKIPSTGLSLVSSFDICIFHLFSYDFQREFNLLYYLSLVERLNKQLRRVTNVICGFWTNNCYMVKPCFFENCFVQSIEVFFF